MGDITPATVGVYSPSLFRFRRSYSSCSIECIERSRCEEERAYSVAFEPILANSGFYIYSTSTGIMPYANMQTQTAVTAKTAYLSTTAPILMKLQTEQGNRQQEQRRQGSRTVIHLHPHSGLRPWLTYDPREAPPSKGAM